MNGTEAERSERNVETLAIAIHDEIGGCCEWGYVGCDNREAAREASRAALAVWFGPHRLEPPGQEQ